MAFTKFFVCLLFFSVEELSKYIFYEENPLLHSVVFQELDGKLKSLQNNNVAKACLVRETRTSAELLGVPDDENPPNPVNKVCAMMKRFLKAPSCFMGDVLQDYLNLFCFIVNPQQDKFKKVEIFINRAQVIS